jgi:hypothetical protein
MRQKAKKIGNGAREDEDYILLMKIYIQHNRRVQY